MDFKLIPKLQYKICNFDSYSHQLHVTIEHGGETVGLITGTYDDVLNMKKIRELCGYDKIPNISQSDYKEIKLAFDEELLTVETQDVYLYEGWDKQKLYYILGNYRINADTVEEIINRSANSKFKLETMPDNKTLCQHIKTRYFRVLKHDAYSKMILCISLLAMFTTRLQETDYQPQFATYVQARFNKGKSSSVRAMINPWNGASFSFEDTEAVLKQALKSSKDVLLIIDDMSKSRRPGMQNKNERIIRMVGDTTTSAKKMIGGEIDDSAVTCMAIMTGEDVPQLQNSSYTRLLIIKYDDDEVTWDILTQLQENTGLTVWFYIRFLQFYMKKADFIDSLIKDFTECRSRYREKFRIYEISNRYIDMMAWILAMWDKVNDFFCFLDEPLPEDDFVAACEDAILHLGIKYAYKTSSQLFLTALFSLIARNQLKIVSFAEAKDGAVFDLFHKDNMYFVRSGAVYDKVKAYYDSQNIDFYDSERAVRKDLDRCGLIYKTREYTTIEFKDVNNHSISGFYLLKNNAKDLIKEKGRKYQ